MIKILRYKTHIFLLLLCSWSFFNSIYQYTYNYDGFHWGLVLFSADGINKNLIPYKELFIHYGILTTYFNSILLKIFNNNFFYIFSASSFAYGSSIFIIGLLIKKYSNSNYALIGSLTIFFIHPYASFPWHTYYIFFLFCIFLLFRTSDNKYYQKFSYFVLSLIILFSESFFIPSVVILIFEFVLNFFNKKKNIIFSLKEFSIKLLFYSIPLFLFFLYLFLNDIFGYWKIYNQMIQVFFEIHNFGLLDLIINYILTIINKIIYNFYSEPQWIIFSVLILFNLFYLIKFLLKLFSGKNNKIESNLAFVSFCSLTLLFQTLHSITTFKFACGLVISFIVFFNFIDNIKNRDNRIILSTITLLLGISCFGNVKSDGNLIYVYDYKKEDYIKNSHFNYFASNKLDIDTWNHLIFFDKKIQQLKKNCNLTYGSNLSSDGIISVIIRDKLNLLQKIPWYDNSEGWMSIYFNTFLKYFDKNLPSNLQSHINKENILIYSDKTNYPYLKILDRNITLKEKMIFIDLPYSYQNKNKILIFPKKCRD